MKTLSETYSNNHLHEASVQWRNRPADQRFETLDALRQSVEGRRSRSRSETVKLADISVHSDDQAVELITKSGDVLDPTHWGFGQLCQRIGAPANYLRSLPNGLVAQNLEHSLRVSEREDLKLLTIEGEGGFDNGILQAVTSTTYGRIWDADVVEATARIVERSGGKFFNPKDWSGKPSGLYASDHDVFCFLIDGGSIVDGGGGGDRDQLHRGFFIWNSETGAKSFGLKTFLFRWACGNHIVWHAEDVTELILRHSQGAPGRFDREAFPKLLEYVNASAKPIEAQVRNAKQYRLPFSETKKGAEALLEFGSKHGFSRAEIRGAFARATEEEGQCDNLWDFVNGLTAHARGYEFTDSRIDLETRAGKLIQLVA